MMEQERNVISKPVYAQKGISEKIPSQELRRLEELRDTKSDRRAQELKKVISDQICGDD